MDLTRADKMFEKLGYTKTIMCPGVCADGFATLIIDYCSIKEKTTKISFYIQDGKISLIKNNGLISDGELKAITEKRKELKKTINKANNIPNLNVSMIKMKVDGKTRKFYVSEMKKRGIYNGDRYITSRWHVVLDEV